MEPVKIYIGTEEAQRLPTEVLKRSILARTQSPIVFYELKEMDLGIESHMYTGFSFYRFCIPEICRYKGRAIYLDADIVVLCDILELFHWEMGGKGVLSRCVPNKSWFNTSVMLMDCEELKSWKVSNWITLIEAGMADYDHTMCGGTKGLNYQDFGALPDYWNHYDEVDETTKIVHYTFVPTQPWRKPGHLYAGVFLKEMNASLDEGRIDRGLVEAEIDAGHVYKGILEDAQSY